MRRRQYLAAATAGIAGTTGCMGATEYTINSASGVSLSDPLSAAVEVIDDGITVDSPGTIDVTISNNGASPVTIRAINVWPFGILQLSANQVKRGGVSSNVTLQSPSYEQTDNVRVRGSRATASSKQLTRPLAAGEAKTVRYVIQGGRLSMTGSMRLRSHFEPDVFAYQTASMSTPTPVTQIGTVEISERSLLP